MLIHDMAAISQGRSYASLYVYAEAWTQAEELREALRCHEDVSQLSLAGSLRRGQEVVRNIDIVASSRRAGDVLDFFAALPWTRHGLTRFGQA